MPLFEIPPGPFDAYLFDCDGTIADSMPLHHQVWLEALRPWQCDFPESLFYEWAGVPIGEVIKRLNDQFKKEMPIEETILAREALYHQFLAQITGVKEVVEQVHLMFGKIPLAVVSGSPRVSVVKTLETLGLLDRFDALVTAEDTRVGKPAPDPYLLAAEKLGVEPTRCLVFEDGEAGIQSAISAGMQWVRIPAPHLRKR